LRFGIAYQPAVVVVQTDGTSEIIGGEVDDNLLNRIISEAS